MLTIKFCYLVVFIYLLGQISAFDLSNTGHKQITKRLYEKSVSLFNVKTSLLQEEQLIDPPKRIAGYYKLDETKDAHMFYFYFQSRAKASSNKLTLWLQGGPGCASDMAAVSENGPFILEKNETLSLNPYGWDLESDLIYVDQPVNTGFSYSKDPSDTVTGEKGVAQDVYEFLQEFLSAKPELREKDFYITGESYGGHYIPSVAFKIYEENKNKDNEVINLKGIGIGNGFTVPSIQYGAYGDYALEKKLINQQQYEDSQSYYSQCKIGLDFCDKHPQLVPLCAASDAFCSSLVFQRVWAYFQDKNVYDIRKECLPNTDGLCYDYHYMEDYFNSPEIKKELGVPSDITFTTCAASIEPNFAGDRGRRFDQKLPPLLESGIQVLIYVGEEDFICNYIGNKRWLDQLDWSQKQDFVEQELKPWSVNGKEAGSYISQGPLTYLRIQNAGHMVPMDQRENSLDMFKRLLQNEKYGDKQISSTSMTLINDLLIVQ